MSTMNVVRSENPVPYNGDGDVEADNDIITKAMGILHRRMVTRGVTLDNHHSVEQYLLFQLCLKQHEIFGAVWLDSRMRVIAMEELFRGTVTQTAVYPREVVKAGLAANAVSCFVYHNHPSGTPTPSDDDHRITKMLKSALELVGIRLLDHIVVGDKACYSFERSGVMPC